MTSWMLHRQRPVQIRQPDLVILRNQATTAPDQQLPV